MSERSGIVQPDCYSFLSPDPVYPYGEAVISFGLYTRSAINGIGAVTRGFLWQQYDIWIDTQYYQDLSTLWNEAFGNSIATSWVDAYGTSVSTTWTNVQFGFWGDGPP